MSKKLQESIFIINCSIWLLSIDYILLVLPFFVGFMWLNAFLFYCNRIVKRRIFKEFCLSQLHLIPTRLEKINNLVEFFNLI